MQDNILQLQSTLKEGSVVADVEFKNNRLYFKIDGHEFNTFDTHVYHVNEPLYSHKIADIWAANHNEPEAIVAQEKWHEDIQKEFDDWDRVRDDVYISIFTTALGLLARDNGDGSDTMSETNIREFVDYIDHFFDVTPNMKHCKKLIDQLKNIRK